MKVDLYREALVLFEVAVAELPHGLSDVRLDEDSGRPVYRPSSVEDRDIARRAIALATWKLHGPEARITCWYHAPRSASGRCPGVRACDVARSPRVRCVP